MTAEGAFNIHIRKAFRRAHGEIRLISVLEPQPAQDGFVKVVSSKVQPSPLKPQFPAESIRRGRVSIMCMEEHLTGLKITPSMNSQRKPIHFRSRISTHAMAVDNEPFET